MIGTDAPPGAAAVRALLRVLAIGLSVHRLYPDNPGASTFTEACARIRVATRDALLAGPVRVEVRSGRFLIDGQPATDAGTDRLAQACFERRVELIGFDEVPTTQELWVWFGLLSTHPPDLDRSGGISAVLQDQGVSAVLTTARAPTPSSGTEVAEELLGLADWVEAVDDEGRSDELDLLHLQPGETGPILYERLVRLSASLPRDGSVRSSFFQRAAWVVGELPKTERAVFGLMLIDRLPSEDFAERYVGHLTDIALAELLGEVAWQQQRDPGELAAEVAAMAGRHATLPRLFETEVMDRRVAPAENGDGGYAEDVRLVRAFPEAVDQQRALAAWALVDVLLSGPREEQFTAILDNVLGHLRDAVRAGARDPISHLLDALDTTAQAAPPELAPRLERPRAQALDVALVSEAYRGSVQTGHDRHPQLLAPFGAHAVAPLVGALAGGVDGDARQRLIEALRVVGRSHIDVLESTLARHGPDFVVGIAPTIARETGLDVVGLLGRLVRDAPPVTLRAIVDALVGHDAERAAPVVVAIAREAERPGLRNHCLDALARMPGGVGRRHLQDLAARDARKLPWRARRRARRLARTGGRRS